MDIEVRVSLNNHSWAQFYTCISSYIYMIFYIWSMISYMYIYIITYYVYIYIYILCICIYIYIWFVYIYILYYIILYYIILYYIILYYIILCYVMLYYVILYYINYMILYYIICLCICYTNIISELYIPISSQLDMHHFYGSWLSLGCPASRVTREVNIHWNWWVYHMTSFKKQKP